MMSPEQVRSIQYIVSSSVLDLQPNNVYVVDNDGITLSEVHDDIYNNENMYLRYSKKIESEVKQKIENILDPLFGKKNFKVVVIADTVSNIKNNIKNNYFNINKKNTSVPVELVSNAKNKKQQPQNILDLFQGNSVVNQISSLNLPIDKKNNHHITYQNSLFHNNNINKNNEFNVFNVSHKKDNITINNMMKKNNFNNSLSYANINQNNIKKISVIVMINSNFFNKDDKNSKHYISSDKIKMLVQQAIGFSKKRSDSISIQYVPFVLSSTTIKNSIVHNTNHHHSLYTFFTLMVYLSLIIIGLLIIKLLFFSNSKLVNDSINASIKEPINNVKKDKVNKQSNSIRDNYLNVTNIVSSKNNDSNAMTNMIRKWINKKNES
ncbi:flagellar M-ring protein FliF C-terminal domain-containing protein [Buchnera aphidicola]|uniref:flagellar M-ring protein FliF C-terminal domain-containing protein n=1 Tax=Buchnera aphidicola TaxID=9 RepID=UPI0034649F93